jgi:hypothetical protein
LTKKRRTFPLQKPLASPAPRKHEQDVTSRPAMGHAVCAVSVQEANWRVQTASPNSEILGERFPIPALWPVCSQFFPYPPPPCSEEKSGDPEPQIGKKAALQESPLQSSISQSLLQSVFCLSSLLLLTSFGGKPSRINLQKLPASRRCTAGATPPPLELCSDKNLLPAL